MIFLVLFLFFALICQMGLTEIMNSGIVFDYFDKIPFNYKELNQFFCSNNFCSYNPHLSAAFDTAATVMASFIAVVFSISLVMIQIGSDKYSFKILEYFVHDKRTQALFVLSVGTILLALLLMGLDIANVFSFALIFTLFIIWIVIFWLYFINIVRITNPEQIAKIMIDDCNSQITSQNEKNVKSVSYSMADTAIKAVYRNDFDISLKFTVSFFDIYQTALKNHSTWAKKIIFEQFLRIIQVAIETKNKLRNHIWGNIFGIPILEILNQEIIDTEFIDYYVKIFIFNINKKLIDVDDFEGYRNEIREYSLIHTSNNPKMVQGFIQDTIIREQTSLITDFQNESDINDKVIAYYNKLNFSLQKSMMDFNYIHILKTEYLDYKNFIETSLKEITPEETNLTNKIAQIKTNTKDVIHDLDSLYIDYQMHFAFFMIGSYLIFKKTEENFDALTYIKQLWEYTETKNPRVINADTPPICFDTNWLTHLWLYGGTGKANFVFSTALRFNFDTFRDPDKAITSYYLLCLTKSLKNNKNQEKFPNQDIKQDYYIKYNLNFSIDFIQESDKLQTHCDELIKNAAYWNYLFDNDASKFLLRTKEWIIEETNHCKSFKDDIVKNTLDYDRTKCQEIKRIISESYNESNSVKNLINIQILDEIPSENNSTPYEIIINNWPKENLVNDGIIYHPVSIAEHVFHTLGQNVARQHLIGLIRILLFSTEIEKEYITNIDVNYVLEKLTEKYQILSLRGFEPSCIILPMKFFRKLYTINAIDQENSKLLLLKNGKKVAIMFLPYEDFEDIILINKNVGIWTYNKQDDLVSTPLKIEFEMKDDGLNVDIHTYSQIKCNIINPEATIVIRYSTKKDDYSRWSSDMFDMTLKLLKILSE